MDHHRRTCLVYGPAAGDRRKPASGAVGLALVLVLSLAGATRATAEGGSIGGRIGGDPGATEGTGGGGSTGGRIPPPPEERNPPEPREKSAGRPAEEPPRRAARPQREDREKAANAFDGTWMVHTVSRCGWSSNTPIYIRGAHVSAAHLSGSVSSSGGITMVSRYLGVVHSSTGRLSGSSGHGSFHRTDGCRGSWSASR